MAAGGRACFVPDCEVAREEEGARVDWRSGVCWTEELEAAETDRPPVLERRLLVVELGSRAEGRPRPPRVAFLLLSSAPGAEDLRLVSGGFGRVRVAGLTVLGESSIVLDDVDFERLRERVKGGCCAAGPAEVEEEETIRVRGRTVLGVGGSLKVSVASREELGVTRRRARLGVAATFGGRGRRAVEEVEAESGAEVGLTSRCEEEERVAVGRC